MTLLNRQRQRRVNVAALGSFLERLTEAVPPGRADRLGVCLVSDQRMREFNRRHRGRNATTDVLSFSAGSLRDPEGGCHLGDIVVCVPRAASQARTAGHSLGRELKVLLVHGYLHLLGYDHEKDRGAMLRLQRSLVRRLFARGGRRGR